MSKPKNEDAHPILEDQLGLTDSSSSQAKLSKEEFAKALAEINEKPMSDVAVSDQANDELALPLSKSKTDLRPWYMRPRFWGRMSLGFLLIIMVALAGVIWFSRSQDAQDVQSRFLSLSQAAERVNSEASRASYDSIDPAYQALVDMDQKIDEAKHSNRPHWLGDTRLVQSLGKTLDDVRTYVDKAKAQAGDLSRVGSGDLDSLKSAATAAKLSVDDFKKSASGIDGNVPDDFYKLNERFDRLIKAHSDAEDTKKAAADAALSKEEQAKQDKADAEETASRWTQAYIAGNVADLKKYMTVQFTKEYDFGQVTSSYRSTNYPTSYRRVSTDKKGDQYEIVETISFITKSDYTADTTYTTTYVFLISQDSSSKKWLVNSQRYQ